MYKKDQNFIFFVMKYVILLLPLACLFWKNSNAEKCDCGTYFKAEERNPKNTRIFKGRNAHLHRYPWQIIIRIFAKSAVDSKAKAIFCGGSLISSRHILTNAHCFFDGNNYRYGASERMGVKSEQVGYKELPEAHIITTNGCVGLVTNNAIEFLFCRKYPHFKGKAYSGVEKATTKYIPQGDKWEQILDVEESKQVQEFNEENVKCHPEYEMDGNIRIFYIFQTRVASI